MGEEINTSISKCAINKAYSTILWKMVVKYLPIYYSMFLHNEHREGPVILPELEAI